MSRNRREYPAEMRTLAARMPVDVFLTQFKNVFGFDVHGAITFMKACMRNRNVAAVAMCLDAAVQIRTNVTFVRATDVGINNEEYGPILLGRRDGTDDEFSFSALHLVGHALLGLASPGGYADKAQKKVGNCVTGEHLNPADTQAKKINAEVYSSVTQGEKTAFAEFKATRQGQNLGKVVDELLSRVDESAVRVGTAIARPGTTVEGIITEATIFGEPAQTPGGRAGSAARGGARLIQEDEEEGPEVVTRRQ